MENIPLSWFKWGLALIEKTHKGKEGRFIPTLLHQHVNQISFDTNQASKNTWAKKKRTGNYWLLFIQSCLRPAACPGWLWLIRASIVDLSTLGGVVKWIYVGQTDFECLVFPSDIIFFWSFCFSPFLHRCLTPLLLLHLASSVCLPNPLKCSLS